MTLLAAAFLLTSCGTPSSAPPARTTRDVVPATTSTTAAQSGAAPPAFPPCDYDGYSAHPELPSPANDHMMATGRRLSVSEAQDGLLSPSRFTRARTLDLMAHTRWHAKAFLAVLDTALANEPSSYVRSEAARVRIRLRALAGLSTRDPGVDPRWKSYVGLWDPHPEPLAAIVAPLPRRPVPVPAQPYRARNRDGCFDFPGIAHATLGTSHGTLVSADEGEFGCAAVLFEPGQPPRTLELCGEVLFEIGKHLYGIYHSGHVSTMEVLHRATRQADGSYTFAAVLLPDYPRGAYALADGTLLIDTGEAAVHVDEEGIASVRPRREVAGLPAGRTEGFGERD